MAVTVYWIPLAHGIKPQAGELAVLEGVDVVSRTGIERFGWGCTVLPRLN